MKALKILAAVVAVVIVGLVIFIATFDVGKYKGVIEQQAKAATGRDVTIGNIKMAVSLTPTVLVEDVTLANAEWGSRPQMVTLKRLEAQAELLPLLSGTIKIGKIEVGDADVLLEVNKAGKANWEFPQAPKEPAKPETAQQQQALNIGALEAKNLKLAYKDAKAGAESTVSLKSASARLEGAVQEMRVTSATLDDLVVNHKAGAVAIDASIAKAKLESAGKITDFGIKEIEVSDAKVTGKTASGPLNAELSKLTIGEKGDLDLAAKYNGETITAKGTVASPAALKGGVKSVPAKLALEGFGIKADVDLTVDTQKNPPGINGSITIPEIDLGKYMKEPTGGTAGVQPGAGGKAAAKGPMFSNDPLPWDSLKGANASVRVMITKLKLPNGQTVDNVVVPVTLADGRLTIKDATLEVFGGKVATNVMANASDRTVAFQTVISGLTAEALAKAFQITNLVTNGPLDVNVNVRGSGNSMHGIASTMSGSAIAGMGESRIRNEALNFIGADVIMQVLNAINPLGNKDPYTVAKCAVLNFQIANGVANTQNGVALVTDKMNLTGAGNINLGPETINMVVKPQATSGLGIGLGKLVSAVKVNGPIASPNIGLDAGGSAKAIGTLGAAFATGGLSMLAQGLKDKTETQAAGDPCQIARTWHQK